MSGDFFVLLIGMVAQLWRDSHLIFICYCLLGVMLGGLAWWLTSWVAHNYNRQFSFHPQHYIYCGVAATITLLFTLCFISLQYTGKVAEDMVNKWKDGILVDKKWSDDTYRHAYEAVYELKDASGKQLENFAGHPHPDSGQATSIPTNFQESRQTAAQTYANGAVKHFRSHHPFLSKVLWARSELAQELITKDMNRVFGSGAHIYQPKDAIQLASDNIQQGLREQVPRVVIISRIVLVVGFLLIQTLTFFLLRHAALAAIREKRLATGVKGA